MPVRGTLKFTELRLAQLSVDMSKPTAEISATAALVDPSSPGGAAWHKFSGNVWGPETMVALKDLLQSMENDMARVVMSSVEDSPDAATKKSKKEPEGLGEFLRGEDPPQI